MSVPYLSNRLVPFCVHFLSQFFWGALGLLTFPILGRAVFASIPYSTKKITDTVLAMHHTAASTTDTLAASAVPGSAGSLTGAVILFVALVCGRFLLDTMVWFCSYRTRSPMLVRIKEEVFAYAQRLSPAYFENTLSGKIAHRAILLPDQALALFDMMVFDFIPSSMYFLFVAAYFYVASPLFCGAAMFSIAVYFVEQFVLVGRECARRAALNNEARAAVTGRIVDVITNIRNVFFFANQALEDQQLKRFTGEERDRRMSLYRSVVRLRCIQYAMDISMWLGFVGGALYVWVNGHISAGDFVMITALTGSLLQTAYNLGQRIPEFYEQLGGAQESIETLIVPPKVSDRAGAPALIVHRGSIHFASIAFAYESARGGRHVVKDFELFIPAGQRVGLVGPSGAGKSTLMGLLMRMHDVTQGAIRIDGQDVREVTQDSLRACLALIPQDTNLLHRSLLENIRYGRPDASDEEVMLAACRAHAHEFIVELEHGYHTMVGERGIKLSGGQRQRIAIARAILREAPILLLDEATSALDSHSEQMIQQAMCEAMDGKTVIAIAHRLSTVMDMDRLIVLQRGTIVADGSHEELLSQGGLYAELWRKQSGESVPFRAPVTVEQEVSELDGPGADMLIEHARAVGDGR